MQPTQPIIEEEPEFQTGVDANGWPIGFFEQTSGSIPELPEREPQGEYEYRLKLE